MGPFFRIRTPPSSANPRSMSSTDRLPCSRYWLRQTGGRRGLGGKGPPAGAGPGDADGLPPGPWAGGGVHDWTGNGQREAQDRLQRLAQLGQGAASAPQQQEGLVQPVPGQEEALPRQQQAHRALGVPRQRSPPPCARPGQSTAPVPAGRPGSPARLGGRRPPAGASPPVGIDLGEPEVPQCGRCGRGC